MDYNWKYRLPRFFVLGVAVGVYGALYDHIWWRTIPLLALVILLSGEMDKAERVKD